ncbi:hypothetical protein GCM10010376_69260 [Streptomyces violaceusniger]
MTLGLSAGPAAEPCCVLTGGTTPGTALRTAHRQARGKAGWAGPLFAGGMVVDHWFRERNRRRPRSERSLTAQAA